MQYPRSHLYFLGIIYTCIRKPYTKKIQVTSGILHSKVLHNYFIPCHRKYSGQQATMGGLGMIPLNCTDRWEGPV